MDRRRLSASASAADVSKLTRRQPQDPSTMVEPRIERIARRAHELYEARGGTHGRALEDWLQAEREIDAED